MYILCHKMKSADKCHQMDGVNKREGEGPRWRSGGSKGYEKREVNIPADGHIHEHMHILSCKHTYTTVHKIHLYLRFNSVHSFVCSFVNVMCFIYSFIF